MPDDALWEESFCRKKVTKEITDQYLTSATSAKMNYSSIEKEALRIVWGIEKLHFYLFGKSFEVVSDHKSLMFTFSPNAKLNSRIARWQIKLQAYEFKVLYEKGETNIADFQSRNGADSNSDNDDEYKHVCT